MIKRVASKIGIDGAIGFSVLGRIFQVGGSLITLTLISHFISTEEQGYYYTFGSLIAIQVFFELGLSGIVTQYVAHETAHLHWISETKLGGSKENLSRLSSLLHFCVRVFSVLGSVLFLVLIVSGFVFFNTYSKGTETIYWQFPWIMIAFSTSLLLIISPILAFLEGLGKVKEVAKIRFIQQIINIFCIGLVLGLHGRLFALGIASFVTFLTFFCSIFFSYRKELLLFVYKSTGESKVDYWKEIFPYQWKISISWISGYFIFQLFNPVLFATEGPIVAGKMGMTLQGLNGISSLSMSWILTKVPLMSTLIAEKKYKKLDHIFNKTIMQLSAVNFLLILVFIVGIEGLNYFKIPLGNRFLTLYPLIILCAATFVNQFTFSWATYLRCHKQEPFLVNSIVGGILTALSTIVLGKYFGLIGIVGGYSFLTVFIGLPWGYLIFKMKKRTWHYG